MNNKLKIILSVIMIFFVAEINLAQVKLAQSGMKFLSVSSDARASSLGEAVTSVEGNSSSMFYNPAAMSRQSNEIDVTFSNTQWFADIKHINAAISYAPSNGLYGVFGASVQSVDYGLFHNTIIGPDGGALDIGTYSPTALAIGIGYARALSDKFSVGGNVRYVYQNIGEGFVIGGTEANYKTTKIDLDVYAFDFGVLYKTGYKSLNFGMSIRNFSQEIMYYEENFQLPLSFRLGLSMNLLDIYSVDPSNHSFLFSVDAEHPRDNKEMLHIGGEYRFMRILSLRIGYVTPETTLAGMNYGIGVNYELIGINFGFDYSYTEFGDFDPIHRMSVKLSF
ncbi:MAG: PorV/PorQ family protein [Bacteroidetes bacterium]|nr:PorV/PorQ family protein [Bacteroidota bacterium]MBU1114726.1 PorV/PorQ family protein [Bacteroidota bacterium]MBU1798928.1 PorV/PorQ family protein [Bacteroidota bacterium]